MKTCQKCKQEKIENDFTKSQSKKSNPWCRLCVKENNKLWKQSNPEYHKTYKQTAKYKQQQKEYKANTKLHIQEWGKEYYQNNKEQFQNYYNNNKEKIIIRTKNWSQKNKDTINSKFRERYLNEPELKLRCLISGRVNEWLKKMATSKNKNSITKYLQYTMIDLKEHLENQFQPWMTWNNHGKYKSSTWDDNDPLTWTWQIDHIIPQCNLPYKSMNEENFQKCWALDNLRPLSAKENIILGARITKRTYS